MMLFKRLAKKAKQIRLSRSSEYHFFLKYRYLLVKYQVFIPFFNLDDEFALTRANIILKGLLNKKSIDHALEKEAEASIEESGRIQHHKIRQHIVSTLKLPYVFTVQDKPFYIPFFNRTMNYIYAEEPDKLYDYPYDRLFESFATSLIDPFENYNYDLYLSSFTPLLDIGIGDASSHAFYHPDFQTVFIINNQGRLDVKIHLLDRDLKKPNKHEIPNRIKTCLIHYFNNDRQKFIHQLHLEGLISEKLYKKVNPTLTTTFIKRELE
jgi:hypothetical protein